MDCRQGTVNFAIEMDIYGKTHYLYSSETTISEIVVSEYNPDLEVLEHKIAAFLCMSRASSRGIKSPTKGRLLMICSMSCTEYIELFCGNHCCMVIM